MERVIPFLESVKMPARGLSGMYFPKMTAAIRSVTPMAEASMGVSVQNITLNNLAMENFSCQMPSGGVSELVKIGNILSNFKSRLDVCVPELTGVKTKWSFSGGTIKSAKALDPKTLKNNICIEKALVGKEFPDSGDCEAVLYLGKEKTSY